MPKKVLIVDADIDSWQSIGAFLGDKEYHVGYSDVFRDALDKVQNQSYDLIIVDMCWPRLDGMRFISRLSKIQPDAIIIAISEFADRELEQEALRNGAHSCLTKPVNEEDILQAIISAKSAGRRYLNTDSIQAKTVDQTLLRGFTPDQQWDFRMIGRVRSYQLGDVIPMNDENGAMVWVESGRLMVCHNDTPVESIGEGEFWGEEAFVNPGSIITYLIAMDDVQMRHFDRKRMMEFFAYHDETLVKRFMINLINCLHLKWNKTISRLVMAIMPGNSNVSETGDATEL